MDPDAIFILLLFLVYLVLLLVNSIALIKKIIRTKWHRAIKIVAAGILIGFLIWALLHFTSTVYTSDTVYWYDVLLGIGALIIGLNWSLNISNNMPLKNRRISPSLLVILLTVAFTILLPLCLHLMGNLFDRMNIMGNNS